MPKKKKPRYGLHRATGQARCRINGKDHYLGEYGSPESRERYDELLAEWFDRAGDVSRHTLIVDDLVLLYMEHVHQHYRKTIDRPAKSTTSGLRSSTWLRSSGQRASATSARDHSRPRGKR